MASQEQLRQRLSELETQIAKLKAEFDTTEFLRKPFPYRAQQTKLFNDLNKERTAVKQQLNDLNKTTPYSSPNPTPVNNAQPTEAQLKNQLDAVNKQIAELEKALLGPPKPLNSDALLRGLNRLKQEKKEIEAKLAKLTQPVAAAATAQPAARAQNPSQGNSTGLQGATTRTRAQATSRQVFETDKKEDWRFRLYLAPNSTYLYNDKENKLLQPLNGVGVIFPYTPTISVSYIANYDAQAVTHSNYKLYFYKDSAVENISIVGEFTAQNTEEANYLLAVIHFFKSVTKMFYGRDQSPVIGTPPPICYLDGFGTYQFNKHPVLINNFSYSLPNDVDYIRASYPPPLISNTYTYPQRLNEKTFSPKERLIGVQQGGTSILPQFTRQASGIPTYVPTKMQITITAYPVISRRDISSNFSVKEYANGNLLLGRSNPNTIGAGMW